MALPVSANVTAVPNFLTCLQAAGDFFILQDPDSAPERQRQLRAELREMRSILAWSPGVGRSARFLNAQSAQARLRNGAVAALARQAGLPMLREYVLRQHLVLYAHSDTEVVLLALKDQRQLAYSAT